MKILTVIGARPQFVKAAIVSQKIKKHSGVQEIILHTGQHFDSNMSDIFFTQMGIPKPDYHLRINGKLHGEMTGHMLVDIEKICLEVDPDFLVVYGDTNSTLAGALVAAKLNIPVIHVEAGLRSFNNRMPEEVNRIVTDRLSSILFCPTDYAVENLMNEGFKSFNAQVINCGDVMYDAAMHYSKKSVKPDNVEAEILDSDFILATLHRAENVDSFERLKACVDALNRLHKITPIILPLHPRTRNALREFSLSLDVYLIEPVGYLEMIYLLQRCSSVVTDSGGLQKEAYFFNKTCLTMREETEWLELVDNGYVKLVGCDTDFIINTYIESQNSRLKSDLNLYGGGTASKVIADTIATL